MPPITPDLSKATATITIFEKGDYTFVIGEPRAFESKREDPVTLETKHSFGVRFPIIDKATGRSAPVSMYLHVDSTKGMVKQFLMAAYGYARTPTNEEKFNTEILKNYDESIDPETGAVGSLWALLAGREVAATVDVQINKLTGEPQNNFRWRTV